VIARHLDIPVQVLYLSNAPILGGTARILQTWLTLGGQRGWRSRLVVPTHSELVEWSRAQGVPTLVDPLPWPNGRLPVKAMWHAWRVARFAERPVDLIHCNEHNVYPFLFLLRKFISAPVVCHVRYKIDRQWAEWAFRGDRCPDALLWTSRQQKEDSAEAVAGIVPESRQHIVRLGFDLQAYGNDRGQRAATRQALAIGDDEILVGTASPLRPRKRVHEFIEIARRLAPRHPRAVFVIAGGEIAGDEAYRQRIEREVAESGLGRRLRWLGFLEPVEPLYHASEIQVSTSEYETFGNSVCEAMACSRPVAAYRGGSVAEVLGDTGLVVETGDLDGLTAAVERLIVDAELRRSLGEAARQRVAEEFNPRRSFEQLVEIYESVRGKPVAGKALLDGPAVAPQRERISALTPTLSQRERG
jgi:glycosyltransferase involved in cell wall biosynthesis